MLVVLVVVYCDVHSLAPMGASISFLTNFFFSKTAEISIVGLQVLGFLYLQTSLLIRHYCQASGKTSFVNVLGSDQWSEEVVPTVAFNLRKGEHCTLLPRCASPRILAPSVRRGNITLKIWDVAGE